MEHVNTFTQFLTESNGEFSADDTLNESSFQYTPTAVKVAKEIMKGKENIKLTPETYDKIKAAVSKLKPRRPSEDIFSRIVKSKKFNNSFKNLNSFEDLTYVFKGNKLISIIDATSAAGQDVGGVEMFDGKWITFYELETWAYEKYPKYFDVKWWEIYNYSDVNKGYGNAGTVKFVEAPTEKIAKEKFTEATGREWDMGLGISATNPAAIAKTKTKYKELAAHYAKLYKELTK